MAEDKIRYDRFQLNPGDIVWDGSPFDVSQEAQDAQAARDAAELAEGRKQILRERLAAEQKSRKASRG